MLEHEKKALLTKEEYDLLMASCKGMAVEFQTNYYFDTDDMYMNRKGITCRIRAKNGTYKTTIKKHGTDCSVEEDLYEGTKFNFTVFGALGMHLQGRLITTRIVLYKDAFCEVVLDRNSYLGYDDFEIEVEYAQECERRAMKNLKNAAKRLVAADLVDLVESFMLHNGTGPSKSERFFEKKKSSI